MSRARNFARTVAIGMPWHRIALAMGAAVAISGMMPSVAQAHDKLTGEQQLAKLLEGRVAGKPVECVNTIDASNSTIIDHTAIVYDNGSTYWVNRPRDAEALSDDQILVTHTTSPEICHLDIVNLIDRTSHFPDGAIGLEQFVPYTRAPKAAVAAPAAH